MTTNMNNALYYKCVNDVTICKSYVMLPAIIKLTFVS